MGLQGRCDSHYLKYRGVTYMPHVEYEDDCYWLWHGIYDQNGRYLTFVRAAGAQSHDFPSEDEVREFIDDYLRDNAKAD